MLQEKNHTAADWGNRRLCSFPEPEPKQKLWRSLILEEDKKSFYGSLQTIML